MSAGGSASSRKRTRTKTLLINLGRPQLLPSTATNKFRYVVQSVGRARHSVRAAVRRQLSERRARSDAPYHVSKFACHSTSRVKPLPTIGTRLLGSLALPASLAL